MWVINNYNGWFSKRRKKRRGHGGVVLNGLMMRFSPWMEPRARAYILYVAFSLHSLPFCMSHAT